LIWYSLFTIDVWIPLYIPPLQLSPSPSLSPSIYFAPSSLLPPFSYPPPTFPLSPPSKSPPPLSIYIYPPFSSPLSLHPTIYTLFVSYIYHLFLSLIVVSLTLTLSPTSLSLTPHLGLLFLPYHTLKKPLSIPFYLYLFHLTHTLSLPISPSPPHFPHLSLFSSI